MRVTVTDHYGSTCCLHTAESQGRPSRPALERLYRQTSATLTQLALMGVGEAAFADMEKEFLLD